MLCFISAARVVVLNDIEDVAVLFYRIVLFGFTIFFYFKVMSQVNAITRVQVILNSSNVIIPVFSKSMYLELQIFF